MAEATMRHGDPIMADYTPGADVSAGQIIVLGNTAGLTTGVAHQDIANGVAGSLEIGGGIYDVMVAGNYVAYSKVYWHDANSRLTTTSTNMALFGFTLEDAAAANATVEVLHQPYV